MGACQVWAEEPGQTATDSQTPVENDPYNRYEFQRVRMGVPWSLQFYAESSEKALAAAEKTFARVRELDRIMSDYDPDSELNRLCRTSGPGKPVAVSPELFQVLACSQQLSQQSQGAFDVTVGPVTRLWRRAWRKNTLPDAALLEQARGKVGAKHYVLNAKDQTVELLISDMQFDLGAIAKGYAADEALKTLQTLGISRALVDASGDIVAGDPPPGKEAWIIQIEPLKRRSAAEKQANPSDQQQNFAPQYLKLCRQAVATSGDANRYLEIEGVRYSHIVDPATGMGLTTPGSVTVIAENGMIADALASAVTVLGPAAGVKLLPHYKAETFILQNHKDKIHSYESPGYIHYRLEPDPHQTDGTE